MRAFLRDFGRGFAITIAVIVLLVGVLYLFGGMWTPSSEIRAEYDALVAAGEAEAIPWRFTIPVPGCVCHSDDPVLTMEHAGRRIRECNSCH